MGHCRNGEYRQESRDGIKDYLTAESRSDRYRFRL